MGLEGTSQIGETVTVQDEKTEPGPGRGTSQTFETILFLVFYGKYPVPGKLHSGKQTSSTVVEHKISLPYFEKLVDNN